MFKRFNYSIGVIAYPAVPESMSATDLINKFTLKEKVLHG
jgi:hypothetical protein